MNKRIRRAGKKLASAALVATALATGFKPSETEVKMRSIYISAAASVDMLRPRASLRVALHVTNRQPAQRRAIA
ncbi:hypothetical protein [Burkholderia lata]|uniref:hypothetical protein n=1 Tax=Burkholderia lata (strain ATCC 17760 / DSM 23089 / LMG 22485 / NCIMB 9086 / R18194 / 383) TaxID=482957 RepID=UPI0015843BCD|nr:hypothetical protein [Burkholderia lata]